MGATEKIRVGWLLDRERGALRSDDGWFMDILEEDIDFRGYVVQVRRLGAGWVARIKRPDGILLPRSPLTDDLLQRDAVIEKATQRILQVVGPDPEPG